MKRLLTAITIPLSLTAMAQQVTYNHDASKMNQFTVQEVGIGALTPAGFYQLLHNKYQRTAQQQNKMAFRTSVGINAYQQVALAEKFDSAMVSRAKIEALNMADRQVDLAWSTEQKKIENKLSDFQRNINRIMNVGGNREQINWWNLEYQKFQTAFKAIKESYMPNSQRKKQYLKIYSEIRQTNEKLIKFIVYLNSNQQTSKLLAAHYTKPDNVEHISKSALTRWRQVGWKTVPSYKPGGGTIIGPIKPPYPWIKPDFPDKPIIGPIRPPLHPIDPIKPVDPGIPIDPIKPDEPDEPLKPVNPFDKFEPVPDKPIIGPIVGPIKPLEPIEPIEPIKPIDPIALIEPDPKPLEPINPDKPNIGTGLKPINPDLIDKPLLPIQPTDQLKPAPDNGMIMTSKVRTGTSNRSKSTAFNTINNKIKS